jgi:hypothetical protein
MALEFPGGGLLKLPEPNPPTALQTKFSHDQGFADSVFAEPLPQPDDGRKEVGN